MIVNRVSKHLQSLQKMIDEFPRENCPNTDMYGARDKMKAKMKVITSLLGVRQKFNMEDPPKMIY